MFDVALFHWCWLCLIGACCLLRFDCCSLLCSIVRVASFVARCLLLVEYCLLFVVCVCLLFVVCGVLFVVLVCCVLFVVDRCCSLFVFVFVDCSSLVDVCCCWLFVVECRLWFVVSLFVFSLAVVVGCGL